MYNVLLYIHYIYYVCISVKIEYRWGARLSAPHQTGLGVLPAFCKMDNGSLSRWLIGWGVVFTICPLLVSMLKKEQSYTRTLPSGTSWPVLGRNKGKKSLCQNHKINTLTLNLLMTTIVTPPSNDNKLQMGFNSAFKGLIS